jgi:hypothetical protein
MPLRSTQKKYLNRKCNSQSKIKTELDGKYRAIHIVNNYSVYDLQFKLQTKKVRKFIMTYP